MTPPTKTTDVQPPGGRATRSLLARAAAGEQVAHPPVWFMRQAGRSLPEYRTLRRGTSMLQSCRTPDLVTEITLQPVRRHGVDAAIFFSDIVVPLVAVDLDIEIVAGTGPVVAHPVRTAADVAAVRRLEEADVADIAVSVRQLVAELGDVPLIGFAGAPYTLASYLIEGGPSKDHARTKALMYSEPAALARAAGPVGRDLGDLPAGADRGRRLGGPAVRLLGRRAVGGRLRRVRAAALAGGVRRAGRPPGSQDPLRGGHRRAAGPDALGGRLGGRRRLADPAGRRGPADRRRHRRCRATSTRRCCWRTGR